MQKYYNEVHQNLFAPLIPGVFLYIDMVTNPLRRHDATEEQEIAVKDRVIASAGEKLTYASPRLVSSFHNIDMGH